MLSQDSLYLSACQLFQNKKYKKAFLKLIQISNKYSHDLDFLRMLSLTQAALRDQVALLKTLKVIADISDSAEDKIKLMHALSMDKHYETSKQLSFKLLGSVLNDQQKSLVYKNLIRIYTIENNFEQLESLCNEMRLLGILDAELYYAQALVYSNNNDAEAAIECLRNAVNINPTFDTGWTALALHHYNKGDLELAKANLEKALDLNPHNTSALKFMSVWTDEKPESIRESLDKVNFYLQNYNFDGELTECHAKLLIKVGRIDLAQLEMNKLTYYFGKQASL
ncbi:MAG: tetratricopeptide repeat protein [Pseudobdellovibrio sp.]